MLYWLLLIDSQNIAIHCNPPLLHGKDIVEIFVKEVVRLHEFPQSIVIDQDRVFISNFWLELFKAVETSLKFSSTYHPQTDGQTEVVNQSLEDYLRCFYLGQPKTWTKWLLRVKYWYNKPFHSAVAMTHSKSFMVRNRHHF